MQLKKFANRIGFTETELKVLLFLAVVLIAGLFIRYLNIEKSVYKNYDYHKEDSLFWAADSSGLVSENITEVENSKDVYKKEVLGLNNKSVTEYKKKELPAEKSINLNTADLKEIMRLPGIGEKTAVRIIELRNIKTRFKNIDDLLEVKGIQNAKLEKIRRYVYVK